MQGHFACKRMQGMRKCCQAVLFFFLLVKCTPAVRNYLSEEKRILYLDTFIFIHFLD